MKKIAAILFFMLSLGLFVGCGGGGAGSTDSAKGTPAPGTPVPPPGGRAVLPTDMAAPPGTAPATSAPGAVPGAPEAPK